MATHDWEKLKRQFTTLNKYALISLRKFAEINDIPYSANYIKNTQGWLAERARKRMQKGCKIEDALLKRECDKAIEVTERQAEIFDKALELVDFALDDSTKYVDMFGKTHETEIVSPSRLKSLAQTLDILQKGQRRIYEMDKPQSNLSAEERLNDLFNQMEEAFKDESG